MAKKILVTGGTGMVGQAFKAYPNCILIGSKDCDLTNYEQTEDIIFKHNPEVIIHLAAKVGGIQGNMNDQDSFFHDNMKINTNVLRAAHNCNVDMVVSMLSTCIYPANAHMPYNEKHLHLGEPHSSNFGYAYAKRMLDVQSRIYREQYDRKYVCAIPNNIFGPNDNFDLVNGHVLPAIIRRIYEAKYLNIKPVFWGDGTPLRQFSYSKDIAKSILRIIERVDFVCKANNIKGKTLFENYSTVNIGTNQEVSIRDVVGRICKIMDYDKALLEWDQTKPSGIRRKPSSNDNFFNLFLDDETERHLWYTDLDYALAETCFWFIKNYPQNIRGI